MLTEGNITLSNTATAGTSVTIDGTPVVMPADGTSGATINVPSSSGLTVTLEDTGTAGGLDSTTFNVGQGSTVVLSEGTYIGTTTFNVAQGAAVDLGGSQRPTFGGTLTGGGVTGAGIGTVQLNGYVNIGLDGLTLNFSGSSSSMFQWMGGGGMFASDGTVTNLGTLNLVGSTDMGVYEDTTLDNFGTMIQTGTGNLTLHSDNVTATTLMIEPGASYLIESDSGIDNEYGGVTSLVNEGTIRKTAGTGTSQLLINAGPSNSNIPGIISNTGTIEADSGTLYLDVPDAADITQVSGNTLTGGTWNALDGATIEFPSGTSITTNAANVTLSGAGAGFNTAGGTTRLGRRRADQQRQPDPRHRARAGAGATLNVAGGYTQTSTGTLNIQIGGTPASGLFGQIVATGTATLAGAFNLSLVNGFVPTSGEAFPVMSFASSSGTFTPFTGLRPTSRKPSTRRIPAWC